MLTTIEDSAPGSRDKRFRGDHGSGLVAGIALIFAFTFLGLVWLARDVDRGVSNRSTAQSIAFQAARSGAQAASVPDLREGTGDDAVVRIDAPAAREAAQRVATSLFASYGVDGTVTSIVVDFDKVSVAVSITDSGQTVTGAGTVRAERAP